MCGAVLLTRPQPVGAPVLRDQGGLRAVVEEEGERLRPLARGLQVFGVVLAVLGAMGAIYTLFFPREVTPGFYSYSGVKAGISGVLGGLGLWRVGASNLDWTEIGLDLQGKTQWGPIIMAPGVLGLPIGALMWFGMREHTVLVGCLMFFSVAFILVGGFIYAREVTQGNNGT